MKKVIVLMFFIIPLSASAGNIIFNPGFDMMPWDTGWQKNFYTIHDTAKPDSDNVNSVPACCGLSSWGYSGENGYALVSQEIKAVTNCTCRVYFRFSFYVSAESWAYCGAHILCKVNNKDYFDRWPGEWVDSLRTRDNTEYEVAPMWIKWEKVFNPSDTVRGIAFCSNQATDTSDDYASVGFWVDDIYVAGEELSVEENSALGRDIAALQILQNPFIKSTTIKYQLFAKARISLNIYDASGALVKTLVNGEKGAGSYDVRWDSRELKSGIYFVTLNTGKHSESRKIVLMR